MGKLQSILFGTHQRNTRECLAQSVDIGNRELMMIREYPSLSYGESEFGEGIEESLGLSDTAESDYLTCGERPT